MSDLLLRSGLVGGRRQDVAIRDGRIHRIAPDLDPLGHEVLDVVDKLVLPGFVETHIHPDKAFIADRTEGLRAGGPTAQTLVAELKKKFTVDDLVVLDAHDAAQAITEQAEKLLVIKAGRVAARNSRTNELLSP